MSYRVTLSGVSDIGRVRKRNEDSMSLVPSLGIAVIADGMGGHPGGDVASRVAAAAVASSLERHLTSGTPGDGGHSTEPHGIAAGMDRAMVQSVLSAHQAVRAEGEGKPELAGMGTTLTALVVDPASGMLTLGHVGDSRAYRLRAGSLARLTTDDTWVQSEVDAARLTPEQARGHPFGHVLTQCLGLEDEPYPHVLTARAEVGDVYMLCTDGLAGLMDDADILTTLLGELSAADDAGRAEAAARTLVQEAKERGGYDNVTVVIVLVE